MSGHTRLFRRGAVYYHCAAVPVDIRDTYGKREETFSLKTKDYREALRLVRIAAIEVDEKFEAHRRKLEQLAQPPLQELSDDQIKHIGDVYYSHLLEENEETRLSGFDGGSFEESEETLEALDSVNRYEYARGDLGVFFIGEAEEVLTWDNVQLNLVPSSPDWVKVARELQAASIRAAKDKKLRNQGEVVETPPAPAITTAQPKPIPTGSMPLLSAAVEEWVSVVIRTS